MGEIHLFSFPTPQREVRAQSVTVWCHWRSMSHLREHLPSEQLRTQRLLGGSLTEQFLQPLHHPDEAAERRISLKLTLIHSLKNNKKTFLTAQPWCSLTDLDDFLYARRADHVGVWVEADLVHYGAVTLQDHESAIHHAPRPSLKAKTQCGCVNETLADKIQKGQSHRDGRRWQGFSTTNRLSYTNTDTIIQAASSNI